MCILTSNSSYGAFLHIFPVVLSANAKEKAGAGEKIASWVAERVANHKKLRGGVHIVDVIPKSPSGKILRRLLRDQIAAEKSGSGQAKL